MVYKFVRGRIVGIPNKDLTPEDVANIGAVIGTWYGRGSLVVSGRDYSPASRMLKRAFLAGLMSVGVDVMDFHESVAGEIAFAIKRFGARGGINVAGYPIFDNHVQFRIFVNPGYEIVGEELNQILRKTTISRVDPREAGWITYAEYIHKLYASALTSFVDVDPILNSSIKIAVSLSHGSADKIVPDMLNSLGVDTILVNTGKPSRKYKFKYPLIEDITEVSNIVRTADLDAGIVISNDASALVVIDDQGKPLLPEETTLVIADNIASGSQVIASDNVFSFIINELEHKGIKVKLVESTEKSIIMECVRERPSLGFNSVGEYIHSLFSLGYDAILTLLYILKTIALNNKKLSTILKKYKYPRYYVLEDPRDPREVAETICSQKETYCRPYIAGYRVSTNEGNIVITYDPIEETTKILIDSYSRNVDKIITLLRQ